MNNDKPIGMQKTDDPRLVELVIPIRLGGTSHVFFHARQTTAPKNYDGFGTIELATWSGEGKEVNRLVLIRDEHFEWQTMRYASGNHTPILPEYFDLKSVEEALWKRIARP